MVTHWLLLRVVEMQIMLRASQLSAPTYRCRNFVRPLWQVLSVVLAHAADNEAAAIAEFTADPSNAATEVRCRFRVCRGASATATVHPAPIKVARSIEAAA